MNKTGTVILSIVLTAVIVGGGVYFYANYQATQQKEELNSQISELREQVNRLKSQSLESESSDQITQEQTEENEKSSNESNLKTYSSSQYNYSFSYPKNWDFSSGKRTNGEVLYVKKTDANRIVNQPAGEDGPASYTIKIDIRQKSEHNSLDDLLSVSTTNEESTLMGGEKAYSFVETAAPSSGPVYVTATYYNDSIYSVYYYSVATKDTHTKYKSVYNDIVDSFEFTD